MAAMTLRLAAASLPGVRIFSRVRKIPSVRRRLPLTIISDLPQPVIIRHALQNLGSPVSETQPTQSLPA